MIFKLTTTGKFYDTKEKEKLEQLGFKFNVSLSNSNYHHKDSGYNVEIEINTIDELVKFCDEWRDLVMSYRGEDYIIEIYDDHRE